MIAKASYFYGWNYEYIRAMPADDFLNAWKAITVIEAQDKIMDMKLSDYPMMNKSDRKAFAKDMERKAFPKSFRKAKHSVSTVQLAELLRTKNG